MPVVKLKRSCYKREVNPAGDSQGTYSYEYCYCQFDKKTTLIREKQLSVNETCVKI